ncbi:hypothetical protein AB0P12_03490 [Streptomyces subrutilus]|uniref:hypothetical protein n=1 Tax=Streptomyces subrutilus TaxID=36818 RepID=UPI0033D25791
MNRFAVRIATVAIGGLVVLAGAGGARADETGPAPQTAIVPPSDPAAGDPAQTVPLTPLTNDWG